jgi:predicted molibdopterin-dependent oxidoreductase YjgC
MALISVGGVALPTPSDLQVGVMMISKSERNANGTMIIEKIAEKIKLAISYNYLSPSDLSSVLNAISPAFFNVTYLDPRTNTFKTSSFYTGDRNAAMIDFVSGVPRYKDVKFDLIER